MKRDRINIYEVERAFEWRQWAKEIPFIKWPADWYVKAVPPFSTGIIRYWIRTDKMAEGESVSIYLDCYDMAGYVGEPYWEVYPIDEDCERYLMHETDDLLAGIAKAIKQKEKEG